MGSPPAEEAPTPAGEVDPLKATELRAADDLALPVVRRMDRARQLFASRSRQPSPAVENGPETERQSDGLP